MKGRLPFQLWQANIIVFFLLFAIGAGVFGVQIHRISETFLEDARDHARLAAGIILLNTRHAMMSDQVMSEIIASLLGNTARFVNYLESVEPFSERELEAFADESGLAGVGIQRNTGVRIEGPVGWLRKGHAEVCSSGGLFHFPDEHLLVFSYIDSLSSECIYLGIKADKLEKLHEKIGVKSTLKEIARLQGIAYARFVRNKGGNGAQELLRAGEKTTAHLLKRHGRPVVEVRMPTDAGVLFLGMDATPLYKTRRRMVRYFFMFSSVLFVAGAGLTFVLYRLQMAYVKQVRSYERQLAAGREEAVLGRAAAGIAHEIRNPLNSVAMGLQRLLMEGSVGDSSRQLVKVMLDEVRRTDRIISRMLEYSRSVKVSWSQVDISRIVEEQIELSGPALERHDITVSSSLAQCVHRGDNDLLKQLVSNLLKNAIEAQQDGGHIDIEVKIEDAHVVLTMTNPCHMDESLTGDQFFDPYFTTRTRGTGLGLAICRRIVQAHHGTIQADIDDGLFTVTVKLPIEPIVNDHAK